MKDEIYEIYIDDFASEAASYFGKRVDEKMTKKEVIKILLEYIAVEICKK
jgi:hypothetical protein